MTPRPLIPITKATLMDSLWIAQLIMYAVFLFSLVAYVTLDGFDLGVGCLHLFSKGDNQRRMMINAIGPVWDGNSTWIVIGGGTLFAAFPKAFSTIAPNFYTPLMLILFGFMLRAASIEFRSKGEGKGWKRLWDMNFFFASLILALVLGLILGNLIQGIALNDQGEWEGGSFLSLYPCVVSLFGVSCFTMHGSLYLLMKSEGDFHDKIRRWAYRSILGFAILWLITTLMTIFQHPRMIEPFYNYPLLSIFPLFSLGSIYGIIHAIQLKKDGIAFLFSCLSIFFLMLLFVMGTFPYLVYSTLKQNSLTFVNSSVSELALWILVGVSLTGIPLSFFYFPYLYKVFKGKIKIDSMSY